MIEKEKTTKTFKCKKEKLFFKFINNSMGFLNLTT
jgi:hypothetical protein